MASEDRPTKQHDEPVDASFDEAPAQDAPGRQVVRVGDDAEEGAAAAELGTARYVIAGYLAGAVGLAYVLGKILTASWNKLAEQQAVVDRAAWITQVAEDGRATWATLVGGIIAIGVAVHLYRRVDIRSWLNEAASELAKVTWPTKQEVTNGTIVVVVATVIATLYVAVLDRFWGFVTDLVYRV